MDKTAVAIAVDFSDSDLPRKMLVLESVVRGRLAKNEPFGGFFLVGKKELREFVSINTDSSQDKSDEELAELGISFDNIPIFTINKDSFLALASDGFMYTDPEDVKTFAQGYSDIRK